ncbi:MAG: ABC transporter permease [Candidatus Fimadaptatus sp.]|jgi:putative aldouronate transport system permease protein
MSQKHANTASLGGDRARLGTFRYTLKRISRHWQLYLVLLIPVALLIIFSYGPMYGVQIAFKDYKVRQGIWGSKWVGMKHFNNFWGTHNFNRLITNTLTLSVYSLLAGFPIPILLALMLNDCGNLKFKKTVQMITYAPHFISTVVMCSIILLVLTSAKNGIINNLRQAFGAPDRIDFITKPNYFKHIYVWSGVWQSMGYSSIIYIAALSGIDPSLHEAAMVDGASKLRRIWHIDLPGIMPTITILLILNVGSLMNIGYEKVLLLQNDLNMSASDIIATYVYRVGLQQAQYSFSAAVGLFNSVVNTILLVTVNFITKKLGETSLF